MVPWLHSLCWYQKLINQRNSFLVVSSSFPYSWMRKQQGNWLSYTVSLYYHPKPCNLGNNCAVKTNNLFVQWINWTVVSDSPFILHYVAVSDLAMHASILYCSADLVSSWMENTTRRISVLYIALCKYCCDTTFTIHSKKISTALFPLHKIEGRNR